ncbi:MAG: sortase [Patescibacteria group bacterium]
MATNTPQEPTDKTQPHNFNDAMANGLGAPSAADMIRGKVAEIYGTEPDANKELAESEAVGKRSKHQQFMYELGTSGRSLAVIQTAWHNYYQSLPPKEQHQVWQEFYASQSSVTGHAQATQPAPAQTLAKHKQQAAKPRKLRDARSTKDVQKAIRHSVTAGGKLEAKHHIQSLLFGLGMGFIVLVIFLFGFFNEVIITPFIQPSRVAATTPLIVGTDSVAPTANPEVIIPKINVEIPVNYDQTTTDEATIENALEDGVVHYPTTVKPGENGNTALFGHSSNNIFNKGKYKFAFVLLHTLVEGDTFYLTRDSKVYVYKVISKTVVEPSNVGVLGPVPGHKATATLITCDPPGTSLHRLVVVGEQISPDPSSNTEASAPVSTTTSASSPAALPGNGPTLWGRLTSTFVGKVIVGVILAGAILICVRWLNKRIMDFTH